MRNWRTVGKSRSPSTTTAAKASVALAPSSLTASRTARTKASRRVRRTCAVSRTAMRSSSSRSARRRFRSSRTWWWIAKRLTGFSTPVDSSASAPAAHRTPIPSSFRKKTRIWPWTPRSALAAARAWPPARMPAPCCSSRRKFPTSVCCRKASRSGIVA